LGGEANHYKTSNIIGQITYFAYTRFTFTNLRVIVKFDTRTDAYTIFVRFNFPSGQSVKLTISTPSEVDI
jgi:hypothetical protein